MKKNIGVLAFHGDVIEHIKATDLAIKKLGLPLSVIPVRTKDDVETCIALIIPGGESTTLDKLCRRENMYPAMKKLKGIFGTCAGAIMLAKNILHKTDTQKSLAIMDITVDRNAYGGQVNSFEKTLNTKLGKINGVFIRAPQIVSVGSNVEIVVQDGDIILACQEKINSSFYLATTFHPEMTTTAFHEYFLQQML